MKTINPPNSNYGIGGKKTRTKAIIYCIYIYYMPSSTAKDYIHDSFNPQDSPKDRFFKI